MYDSFFCSVLFLNIVTTMAESSTRAGLAVVCNPCGLDANAVRFTGSEFEA